MVSSLRKLLWILAAFAAMVLLAPVAASAHEGHRTAVVHVSQHHESGHLDGAMVSIGAEARVAQPSENGGSEQDSPCTAGCCFGMGCCAGTIVSDVPAVHPPSGVTQVVPHGTQPLVSAPLTSLLEPPDALA